MKKALTLAALYLFPVAALAQVTFDPYDSGNIYLQGIVDFANNVVVPFIIAAAILVFIIGVFWYFVVGAGDDTKKEKGKSLMIWGVGGLVLILVIQGLVVLLSNVTGLDDQTIPTPDLPNAAGE